MKKALLAVVAALASVASLPAVAADIPTVGTERGEAIKVETGGTLVLSKTPGSTGFLKGQ